MALPNGRGRKHIVSRYFFVLTTIALVAADTAPAVGAAAPAKKPPIAGREVLSGKRVALRQFRGRPVFVNIWGSWCGGCNTEARTLARFAKAHRREVAFLGIDTMDSRTGARAFYDRYDTDYPSIWDPRGRLAGFWARGVPSTLVFDRKHRFVLRIEGPATPERLRTALRRATQRT